MQHNSGNRNQTISTTNNTAATVFWGKWSVVMYHTRYSCKIYIVNVNS